MPEEKKELEIEQEETDAEISDVETEEISTEEDFTDSEEEVDSVGTTSGICGKNVKWRISGSTLILSGSGEMVNYAGDLWEDQREYISKIEIGNNITTIASFAFRGFNNVRSITIGGNVSVIGTCAFAECSNLQNVTIGNKVTVIGRSAFEKCRNLSQLTLVY